MDRIHILLDKLQNVKPNGSNKWMASCPVHEDTHPSLSVALVGDGKILLKCFGCDAPYDTICKAVDFPVKSLFPEDSQYSGNGNGKPRTPRPYVPPPPKEEKEPRPPEYWKKILADCEKDPFCRRGVDWLGEKLGVWGNDIWHVGCRWQRTRPKVKGHLGMFLIAERNGCGDEIGVATRDGASSRKACLPGSKRGLTYDPKLPDLLDFLRTDPDFPQFVLMPEGFSDTMAISSIGLPAVGRPNTSGGIPHIIEWCQENLPAGMKVLLIADRDKQNQGKEGAFKVAHALIRENIPVRVAYPPGGHKDTRSWLNAYQREQKPGDSLITLSAWFLANLEFLDITPEGIKEETLDPNNRPCPKCRCHRWISRYMANTETGDHWLMVCPCENSFRCSACLEWNKFFQLEVLDKQVPVSIAAGNRIYKLTYTYDQKRWANIRSKIKRLAKKDGKEKNYQNMHQSDHSVILFSTVQIEDAVDVTDTWLSEMEEAAKNAVPRDKGKSWRWGSRDWSYRPQKDSSGKWEVLVRNPCRYIQEAFAFAKTLKLEPENYHVGIPGGLKIKFKGHPRADWAKEQMIEFMACPSIPSPLREEMAAKYGIDPFSPLSKYDIDYSLDAEMHNSS
jgi:hypothetical protein